MNRRDFLLTSTVTAASLALGARAASPALPDSAKDLLREIIRANDAQIPALLARQERRAGHRWIGGLTNTYGLHTVQDTSGFISALSCAACAPDSKYFNSVELVEPLRRAFAYLLVAQHADGTVDYYATNFHSNLCTISTIVSTYLCSIKMVTTYKIAILHFSCIWWRISYLYTILFGRTIHYVST